MSLPKVLVTDVIRSAHQGDSHGGVHLVDLESGEATQVLDWNDDTIDWSGRGGDRGLRGIAFHNDHVVIAASNEIFVFDQQFKVVASYANSYLSHAHEIAIEGDRLYVTSTKFNSILVLDLAKGAFVDGYHVREGDMQVKDKRGRVQVVRAMGGVRFDPNGQAPVPPRDVHHVNSVWRHKGKTFLGGVRMEAIMHSGSSEPVGRLLPLAPTPRWTHNARPYLEGVIYNATEGHAIVFADKNGKPRVSLAIPTPDPAELDNTDLPKDFARSGFGRGLIATEQGIVIGGASPSTVTAYKLMSQEVLAQVRLTRDVRNTPHGLEIWPYG
ncbi:MAG: hypothetical protein AAGI53_11395 [Planctomycetota bacterium]